MQFIDFNIDMFLRDHWQQWPLLIRNPWASWANPLEPDELAGLACETEVESRLIEYNSDNWRAENGPFPEERFTSLGQSPWTLLVQAVDHYVPDVAALIAPFRFIPNWRIDDVMVSLANDGGGVGPHFDQYDVFLIQGLGRRRWQVGAHCDASTPLLPHDDLRLLADFVATDEWVLEPGDMLYVPPGISHNGIAVGDECMTYSIGFRAPSRAELIGHYADDLLDAMSDDDRYGDARLQRQSNPGEISADAMEALHAMITERLGDKEAFARWFGQYNTTPKYPDIDWTPDEAVTEQELSKKLAAGEQLIRNPASRFSFARVDMAAVTLFVDGECFDCSGDSAELAERICAQDSVAVSVQSNAVIALIMQLMGQGSIAFDDTDEDEE